MLVIWRMHFLTGGILDNFFSVLSFACAKESTKEKHSANDVRPLAPP